MLPRDGPDNAVRSDFADPIEYGDIQITRAIQCTFIPLLASAALVAGPPSPGKAIPPPAAGVTAPLWSTLSIRPPSAI
jgi:hypothetical protein